MAEVAISTGDGIPVPGISMGSSLAVHVRVSASQPIRPVLGVGVKTSLGLPLFGINNYIVSGKALDEFQGEAVITCHFDRPPLMPGMYGIDLYLGDGADEYDMIREA